MYGTNTTSVIIEQLGQERRDSEQIIHQLIDVAGDGVGITRLMYRCNMSYSQVRSYLDTCLKTNLIEQRQSNGKNLFSASEKGNYFAKFYRCQNLLSTTGGVEDPYINSYNAEIETAIPMLWSINTTIEKKLKSCVVNGFKGKKRNRNSIIEDMLNAFAYHNKSSNNEKPITAEERPKKKIHKTPLKDKANLSTKLLESYLPFLETTNLVKVKTYFIRIGTRDFARYLCEITGKGEVFRQIHKIVNWMVETTGYPFNNRKLLAQIEAVYSPLILDEDKTPDTEFIVPIQKVTATIQR